MKITWGVLVVVLVGSGLREARAADPAPPTPEAEARRHFEDGFKEFNLGEFRHAAEEYKAAYRAKPDPAFLYNIGQAYRLANDPTQALFFYKSFLRGMPNAPNRREVEDRIKKLELQLSTNQQPPNVPMTPGQKPVETPVEPPAPEPKAAQPAPVAAPPPAAKPADASPAPEKQETHEVAADATPQVVAATPPHKTPVYKKWWLWTTVGVVVVGAGLGAGLAIGLASKGPPSSALGTQPLF